MKGVTHREDEKHLSLSLKYHAMTRNASKQVLSGANTLSFRKFIDSGKGANITKDNLPSTMNYSHKVSEENPHRVPTHGDGDHIVFFFFWIMMKKDI